MPIILKHGSPHKCSVIYRNVVLVCPACGCAFMLSPDDAYEWDVVGTSVCVWAQCPECFGRAEGASRPL
jgi:hypothetical protein